MIVKNIKAKELIEILQTMDQNAFVCRIEEIFDLTYEYSTIESCLEQKDVEIVTNNGDIIKGNVVAIC